MGLKQKIYVAVLDHDSSQNKISLIERSLNKEKHIQETIVAMAQPVEVDDEDINQILVNVEGVVIGDLVPPQGRQHLIITELLIERKSLQDETEVFMLSMEILQRGYSP